MPNLNRITIEGHLGQEPDVRYTATGTKMVNISVATSYTPKGGEKRTEWHRVVAYGYCADQLEHATKGEPVHVTGRVETRKWKDRDGNERSITEIVAESAHRINWQRVDRGEHAEDGAPRARTQRAAAPERFEDDDLPF